MGNPVRISTIKVVEQAQLIKIDQAQIFNFVRDLVQIKQCLATPDILGQLKTDDRNKILTFLFLTNRTGFCFWNREQSLWSYRFRNGKQDGGQFSYLQAWVDFFNDDPKRADLEYFANLSFEDFEQILQGGKNLYFLKERWAFIKEISTYFLHKWNGEIEEFILSASHRLNEFLPLLVSEISNYDDKAIYQGEKVCFWKLAQLLVYDLLSSFPNEGVGQFEDVDYLTGLPDYKLPQLFEENRLLVYADSLEKKIMSREILPSGSSAEVEIRSATVVLIDLLYEEYLKQGEYLELFEFEKLLFMKAKTTQFTKPYHLVKSLYY